MQTLVNFDTHAAVKRLHDAGLENKIAEEIVSSMVLSRDYDLSKLVTKDQLFRFKEEFGEHKQEVSERFNKIDTEIALIKQEIKALRKDTKADIDALRKDTKADIDALRKDTKADIDALRKDTKANIDALRKDVIAEVAKGKSDIVKWMVGLFVIQATSTIALLVTFLIRSHF